MSPIDINFNGLCISVNHHDLLYFMENYIKYQQDDCEYKITYEQLIDLIKTQGVSNQ